MATIEQNVWIHRVLGMSVGASASTALDGLPTVREVVARLSALRDRVSSLPRPEIFTTDLREAVLVLKLPDLAGALARTEELEARVSAAERATAAAREIAASVPENVGGVVSFAKLRLALGAAFASRHTATINLRRACLVTLNDSDDDTEDGQVEDPLVTEARAAIGTIEVRFPPMDSLRASLDALADTSPARRERQVKAIVSQIDAYMAELDREPIYRDLQESAAGRLPIYDAVQQALSDLRSALLR